MTQGKKQDDFHQPAKALTGYFFIDADCGNV
jgi:hypothetical protein